MLSMHWPGQIREVRTHLQNQERPSIELLRNFNAKKVLSFSRPPIPYCHRAPSLEFKSVREGRKSPLLPRILSQDMSQKLSQTQSLVQILSQLFPSPHTCPVLLWLPSKWTLTVLTGLSTSTTGWRSPCGTFLLFKQLSQPFSFILTSYHLFSWVNF